MFNDSDPLIGHAFGDGWTIRKRLTPSSTGGHFSTGYLADHPSNAAAFVKVLDLNEAIRHEDMVARIQELTSAFAYERDLLEACKGDRLSRVVQAFGSGQLHVPEFRVPRLPYLLFERADTDIRRILDVDARLDLSMRLRYLHQVATGINQLHSRNIAHQDIKPSNVLVFEGVGAKVGDLGRASIRGRIAPHDVLRIAGDRGYAPPEALYGEVADDFSSRRLGCDMFQFASLAYFLFESVGLWPAIRSRLHAMHMPGAWRGTYHDVLPYIQAAFTETLEAFGHNLPTDTRDRLRECLLYVGNPDPARRGHPQEMRPIGNQFAMRRFVSSLNHLAVLAETGLQRMAIL